MDSIFPIRGMQLDVNHTPAPIDLSVDNKTLHLNYLRGEAKVL